VERVDAVIAGVNKAGTTSLFVSLSEHPDVVASAIKEKQRMQQGGQLLK